MLFNSYEFIFLFFPATITAYLLLGHGTLARGIVLVVASLVFYARWDARFLILLLGSIAMNYGIGVTLQRAMLAGRLRRADLFVALGVALNLGVLGVFKYASFAVENLNALTGTDLVISRIVLPLGISFFTFEQIGFLADLRRGAPYRLDLLRYAVFVSFFPRLVAGPILRYNEIVPQLEHDAAPRDPRADLAIGLSIFAIGLVKKSFFADGIAPFVSPSFNAAMSGQPVDFFAAWGGAIAYTCQLYFDFSGYSDMAIGAARCLGIRFPENFNSPYKSASIIEFWRRWHMTLSRFLRDYLYISLGGNRRGKARRYVNLMVTMLLGGFWHGANWTFLVWGTLHGCYLVVNHAWAAMAARSRALTVFHASVFGPAFGFVLTFLAVVVAWVFFRAPTLGAGLAMLGAMAGQHGAELPAAITWHLQSLAPVLAALGVRTGGSGTQFIDTWLWIGALLPIAFLAPNTQEILARARPTLERGPSRHGWPGGPAWAVAAGLAAFLGFLSVTRASAFLYWQF
jgi:D-alanyl-lipoteichoic acid acyltransferase DltB (MBOAT superfamily)